MNVGLACVGKSEAARAPFWATAHSARAQQSAQLAGAAKTETLTYWKMKTEANKNANAVFWKQQVMRSDTLLIRIWPDNVPKAKMKELEFINIFTYN